MNPTPSPIPDDEADATEKDFVDMLIVVAKHKTKILLSPVVAAVVVAGLSLLMPNIYKATTKILPPQQAQSGAAALLAQLGGVAGAAAGAAGVKNPNDLYVAMLKSRRIADKIVANFKLKEVYDKPTFEKTRRELDDNSTIASGKDGLITIEVEDKDKKRATNIANAYVAELLDLTKVLAVTEAGQRRMFFERELADTKTNLAAAESLLRQQLETNGVVSVDSDSRAVVETVSKLRAQIAAKEIQLRSMKAFVTTENNDYKRVLQELLSLRDEFGKLQNGRPASEIIGTEKQKSTGLDSIKLLRDVKYHQMLYELLSKQFEVARLDEAKDSSIVQVLDVAIEPETKFKPKRGILVGLAALLGLFFGIAWAFVSEAVANSAAGGGRNLKMEQLKSLAGLKVARPSM